MPVTAHRHSLERVRHHCLLILTASALAAALLAAVAPHPAGAIDQFSEPDMPPEFTACLGPALEDQDFEDVAASSAFTDDINCLAYYGITRGTGDGSVYSPSQRVSRWQMAVFLDRAMRIADITAPVSRTDDAGLPITYEDTEDRPSEVRNAITRVVRAGVMTGRTEPRVASATFAPDDSVTRVEMATFLVNLVALASRDVVKQGDEFFLTPRRLKPDDAFADALSTLTTAENNAISAAYELGITRGVGDGTRFNGSGHVTRGQMAAFIMRALAHSNLRPEGVTVQAVGADVLVSLRNADFEPVPNRLVDVFAANDASVALAFRADGTCSNRVRSLTGLGSRVCVIDSFDPITGNDGDAWLNPLSVDQIGDGITLFAWTDSTGRALRAATQYSMVRITKFDLNSNEVTKAVISSSVPEGADLVAFGTTATFTLQLRGETVDEVEVDVGAGRQRLEYELVKRYYTGKRAAGRPVTTETEILRVQRDGSLKIDVTVADPQPARRDNNVTVTLTLSRRGSNQGEAEKLIPEPRQPVQYLTSNNDPRYVSSWRETVIFSEETPTASKLTAVSPGYRIAPAVNTSTTNVVLATLIDQYGNPLPGATVRLTSVGNSTLRVDAVTGNDGIARITYLYRGGAGIEILTLSHDRGTTTKNDDMFTSAYAYWVIEARSATGSNDNVLTASIADRAIIVRDAPDASPVVISYDPGDQLFVNGKPSSFDQFSKELADALELRRDCEARKNAAELQNRLKASDDPPVAVPSPPGITLDWESYDYTNITDIAAVKLLVVGGTSCKENNT